MKYRKDYVTNSSSSSYVCEICGRIESGWDLGLSEADMAECVNGHIFCLDEMLSVPRETMLKIIKQDTEYTWSELRNLTEEDLQNKTENELTELMLKCGDGYYGVPEESCPICQFIEYSNHDLAKYLEIEYGVSRDEVFEKVKELNKRRKKLYDSEYITEVCSRFGLNPTKIVTGLKNRFATYRAFHDYISQR